MFDIGFSELLLVMIIGLVVIGPERLPVVVKTVSGWIRALRSLATNVQHELARELKLQELQESLKKVEQASLDHLTPELKASMDELKNVADSMRHTDPVQLDSKTDPIQRPVSQNQTVAPPLLDEAFAHEDEMGFTLDPQTSQLTEEKQDPQAEDAEKINKDSDAVKPRKDES